MNPKYQIFVSLRFCCFRKEGAPRRHIVRKIVDYPRGVGDVASCLWSWGWERRTHYQNPQSVKRVEIQRWFLVILLCVLTSGCVSSQIIPKESVPSTIRTISVVPIECPPLLLHPANSDERMAIEALMQSAKSPTSVIAPSVNGPGSDLSRSFYPLMHAPSASIRTGASVLAIIGGMAMLVEAASAGKEVSGETVAIETDRLRATWMPSVEYAKTAMMALRRVESRDVRVIDGYVRLPITDRSISWHMENWLGPIRRWYNSDLSNLDYTAIGSNQVDAILEVGVLNYEYFSKRLLLQVVVKMIDSHTKRVLGRARNSSHSKVGPLTPLLQNDGEGMKRLIIETGNDLLVNCLNEIRLIQE